MSNERIFAAAAPALAMVALFGCASVLGIPSEIGREDDARDSAVTTDAPADDDRLAPDGGSDAPTDAAMRPDAKPPPCDVHKPFATPVLLASVSDVSGYQGSPKLSEDELTIYFDAQRGGDVLFDLYTASRTSITDTFGPATPMGAGVNTSNNYEFAPNVSADGLSVFFERKDAVSTTDVFHVATRSSPTAPWGTAIPLAGLSSGEYQTKLDVRGDGSDVYFIKKGGGAYFHLYNAHRSAGGSYAVTALTGLNGGGTSEEYGAAISADGLTLYFASTRGNADGNEDVWVATRSKITDDFLAANISVESTLNSPKSEEPSWLSPDGCRLYMQSDRPRADGQGKQDLYVATKPP